ncbi:MAG: hypothetical protein ABUT20_10680 [Bacteroidota bacterium]
MRIALFLLLIFPAIVNAQYTHSATEFAKDNILDYVTGKLFKGSTYKPVSYGELKLLKERKSGIEWVIEHEFEITEVHTYTGKKEIVHRPYKFAFYFDEKMKVIKAESYYLVEG